MTRAIRRAIVRMRAILTDHMQVAQSEGILPGHIDPARAALLIMAVAWGSHVLIEAGVDKDDALEAAKVVFDLAPSPA